jgi:hypothetical protein
MFRFFKAGEFHDTELGNLEWSGGRWKGSCSLPPEQTGKLALSGSRKAPEALSVDLAKELQKRYVSLRPAIAQGLFEHYEPYGEELAAEEGFPLLEKAEAVWPHVSLAHVLIEPLERILTVEIAFRVGWDEEHTVAARFHEWRFMGLCGSVMNL